MFSIYSLSPLVNKGFSDPLNRIALSLFYDHNALVVGMRRRRHPSTSAAAAMERVELYFTADLGSPSDTNEKEKRPALLARTAFN